MSLRRLVGGPVVAGAVLTMAFSVPGTATAAQGDFYVNSVPRITEPLDYACYPLDWNKNDRLNNQTNRAAYVYNQPGCKKNNLVLVLGQQEAGRLPYGADGSVNFLPSPWAPEASSTPT
ncbi:hypothetical protein IL38_19415 [Actinopolyspora erythraea]|nr:hypothetical protein [Actinopolyspora erythraea]KGI80072.1 hypothetical protein IL38_19415 [Actinopolyspora erythraea]